jgi:hypothetical protein
MFLNVLIHFSWYGNVNLIFLLLAEPLFAFLYFEFPFIKFQRPNAKDLLKHRFIRNARKSPRLLERIRCDILLLSITLPLKLIWFPKFFLFPSSLSLFFFFLNYFSLYIAIIDIEMVPHWLYEVSRGILKRA